jgi:DNA adenine methylase
MRDEILNAHYLLSKRATAVCADFEDAITEAGPEDLVYMDPPYMGVTNGHHKRYHQGLARERLIAVLEDLVRRRVPYVLSYDGRTGDRTYGEALPPELGRRIELHAGRSSQETLNGRHLDTVESLYISWCLT